MTLATGIEIGSGGSSSPGLGKAPGAALGTGRVGTAKQGFLPPIAPGNASGSVPGTESFRAGWQSLLASLAPSRKGFAENEAEADQGKTPAQPATAKAAGKTLGSTLTLANSAGLRVDQGREKGSCAAGAEARPSLAVAQDGETADRKAAGMRDLASTRTEERKPAPEKEAASIPQSTHTLRAAKNEAAAVTAMVEPAPGLFPAAGASAPQTVAPPAIVRPSLHGSQSTAQPVRPAVQNDVPQGNLPVPLPGGFALAAFSQRLSASDRSVGRSRDVKEAAQGVTEEGKPSARQGPGLPALSLSGRCGPAPSAAELTSAQQEPAMSATLSAAGGGPLAKAVLGQNTAQPVARSQESIRRVVPSEMGTPVVALSLSAIQPERQGRDSTRTLVSGQTRTQAIAPDSGPIQTVAPRQDATLTIAASREENSTPATGPSLILPETPSLESTRTAASIQTRTQADLPVPTPTESFVPRLDRTLATAASRGAVLTLATGARAIRPEMPGREPTQEVAPNQIGRQESARGLNPIRVVAPGRGSFRTFGSKLDRPPVAVPGTEPIQPGTRSQDTSRPFVRGTKEALPHVPGLMQTQSLAPNRKLDEAAVPGQEETLATAPTPSPVQPDASNQDSSQTLDSRTLASSPGRIQAAASGLTSVHTLASSPDLAESLVPSNVEGPAVAPELSPIQSVGVSQDLAPILVQSKQESRAAVPDLSAIEAAPRNRGSSRRFVPSENRASIFESPKNPAEPLTPRPNPAQEPASSQTSATTSPTPIAMNQTVPERPGQSQYLAETIAPSQDLPQTATPSQKDAPAQPAKQAAEVTPAAIGSAGPEPLPVAVSAASAVSLPVFSPVGEAVPVIAGRATSSGAGNSRSARGAGKLDAARDGIPLVQVQPSSPLVDASAVALGVEGARGTASLAGASTVEASGPNTFEALDSAGVLGKPAWIHAGAQRAEAGFQDPALGWVGVRAELGGGRVHAEVVPGSADAAQALSGHLAGLNAYLAEHHTPVEPVTMTPTENGWAGPGRGGGADQNLQQETGEQSGQQTGQQSEMGAETGFPSGPSGNTPVLSGGASELPVFQGRLNGSGEGERREGLHISVMA